MSDIFDDLMKEQEASSETPQEPSSESPADAPAQEVRVSPQENPPEPSTEPAGESSVTDDAALGADHTVLPVENQAQSEPAPQPETLEEWLDYRIGNVTELLREKESLQLEYVYKRAPKAYYLSWKQEANEVFNLMVKLSRRKRRLMGSPPTSA